jgi:hypothetical protein
MAQANNNLSRRALVSGIAALAAVSISTTVAIATDNEFAVFW